MKKKLINKIRKIYVLILALIFVLVGLAAVVVATDWNTQGNYVTSGEFIGSTNSMDLVFKTYNYDRMVIKWDTGYVGIGTMDPYNTLDVAGNMAIGTSYAGTETAPYDGMIIEGEVGIGTSDPGAAKLAIIGGNVGIGTTNKLSKLTLVGQTSFILSGTVDKDEGYNTLAGAGTKFLSEVGIGDKIDVDGEIKTVTAITSNILLTVDSNWETSASSVEVLDNPSLFRVEDSSNAVKMVISDQGKVGIGTMSPQYTLEVVGDVWLKSDIVKIGYASKWDCHLKDAVCVSEDYRIVIDEDNNQNDRYFSICKDEGHNDQEGTGTELMRCQENGNVGIATPSPSEKLDVNGKVRIRDLPVGGAINTMVVADATGVLHKNDGSWLLDKDWFEVGTTDPPNNINDDIYTYGKVGIGTADPSSELEVMGDIELTNLLDHDESNFFDGGATASQTVTGILSTGALLTTSIFISETGLATSVAGNGLIGGDGVALAVGAGNGITVNANDVAINLKATSGLEVDENGLALADSVAGNGLTILNKILAVGQGNGITVNNNDIAINLKTPSGLEVGDTGLALADSVAGNGLTISNKVLAVSTGNDIVVDNNNVKLEDDIDVNIIRAVDESGLKLYDDNTKFGISIEDEGDVSIGTGTHSDDTQLTIEQTISGSNTFYGIKTQFSGSATGNIYGNYVDVAGTSGGTFGVYGRGQGTSINAGVYGVADGAGTSNAGIKGLASGASVLNKGVYGLATGNSGTLYGVHGLAEQDSSNIKYGVYGEAKGNAGTKYGVYAEATASGGTNYGIKAIASGSGSYAGYFTGATTYINGLFIDSNGYLKPISVIDGSAPTNSIYYSTNQNKLVYYDGTTANPLY